MGRGAATVSGLPGQHIHSVEIAIAVREVGGRGGFPLRTDCVLRSPR